MKNRIFPLVSYQLLWTSSAMVVLCASAWSQTGTTQTPQRPAPPTGLSASGSPGQTTGQSNPPAGQTGQPAAQIPAVPAAPALPPHKTPPAAKTADEFTAYNAAVSNPDIAAAEKAADDFATKFTQSDLRGLLYSNIMRRYQQLNDSEK